jgi:hypothetical protein
VRLGASGGQSTQSGHIGVDDLTYPGATSRSRHLKYVTVVVDHLDHGLPVPPIARTRDPPAYGPEPERPFAKSGLLWSAAFKRALRLTDPAMECAIFAHCHVCHL